MLITKRTKLDKTTELLTCLYHQHRSKFWKLVEEKIKEKKKAERVKNIFADEPAQVKTDATAQTQAKKTDDKKGSIGFHANAELAASPATA